MKKIAVIGIGRIGLPLALVFSEAGYTVFGVDVDKGLIAKLVRKEMPFHEKGADELLEKNTGKTFFPTLDSGKISDADFVIITLGTPVDEHMSPDYKYIEAITPVIIKNLKRGQLVTLRSTVSPGTTESIKNLFEKETGLVCGKDFYMAFCPERIAEGHSLEELKEVPQIIGGITPICSEKAKSLFSKIADKCLLTDARSAEIAKIFTNMYRYINFAIANEFAEISMENDRNIFEIMELVNKDYKRGGLARPGFTAGPCLYKDGFFLQKNMPFEELMTASWKINENLPLYLIGKIKNQISLKNKKVAILGMAFKKDIDDTRNSLSFKLKKALAAEGCSIDMHDPFLSAYNKELKKVVENADVVIIAVNHSAYSNIKSQDLRDMSGKEIIICDLWNATQKNDVIYRIK